MFERSPTVSDAGRSALWLLAACLAVAFPTLLAFNLPPSPTFFNQATAFVGWGVWGLLLASAAGSRSARPADPGHAALLAALAVMAIAAAVSPLWSALPWTLALSYLGSLLAAMLVVRCSAPRSPAAAGASPPSMRSAARCSSPACSARRSAWCRCSFRNGATAAGSPRLPTAAAPPATCGSRTI